MKFIVKYFLGSAFALVGAWLVNVSIAADSSPINPFPDTKAEAWPPWPTTTAPQCAGDAAHTWSINKQLLTQLGKKGLLRTHNELPIVVAELGETVGTVYTGSTLPLTFNGKECFHGRGRVMARSWQGLPMEEPSFNFVFANVDRPVLMLSQHFFTIDVNRGRITNIAVYSPVTDLDTAIGEAEQIAGAFDGSKWARAAGTTDSNLYSTGLKKSYESVDEVRKAFSNSTCADTNVVFAAWQQGEERIILNFIRSDIGTPGAWQPGCHPVSDLAQHSKSYSTAISVYYSDMVGKEIQPPWLGTVSAGLSP